MPAVKRQNHHQKLLIQFCVYRLAKQECAPLQCLQNITVQLSAILQLQAHPLAST